MFKDLDGFIESLLGGGGDHYPLAGPAGRRAVCFASGSNEPSEVWGFASVGIPPGLAADCLVRDGGFAPCVDELGRLAGTGMPVLLDSGAFGAFTSGVEITDAEWTARLELYLHLAKVLGRQLYLVAPDKVGDQEATLALLARYALEVREAAGYGAQFLMPLQPGAMALDEFQQAAQEVVGLAMVPAFPMRGGVTPEEVVAFVRAMAPPKIHLLGLGAANRKTQGLLDALWEVKPDLHIQQDAMLLKSRVGTKVAPRQFDITSRKATSFCEEAFADVDAWDTGWRYTDEAGDPSAWLPKVVRGRVVEAVQMTPAQARAFKQDPTEFLQSPVHEGEDLAWWEVPHLQALLDAAWAEMVQRRTATRRRAWAIHEAFSDHPAAHQFSTSEGLFAGDIDPGPSFRTQTEVQEIAC